MDRIKISRCERDLLREAARDWAGPFDDLAGIIDGRLNPDQAGYLFGRAETARELLGCLGWAIEGDADSYELPLTTPIEIFLIETRDLEMSNIEEGEPAPHAAERVSALALLCERFMMMATELEPVAA